MFGLFKKKTPPKPNASQIVPRIKHYNFLEAIASTGMDDDDKPLTESLVGDLLVTYAFELSDAFQMIRPCDLKEINVTASDLRGIAVENLKSRVGQGGYHGDPPVLRIVLGDNFDACALLYDDLWAMLGEKIPPELIVGVPHRDVVLLTTTASTKGGLEQMREMVDHFHAQDQVHGLTRDLFVRSGDYWEVYEKAK